MYDEESIYVHKHHCTIYTILYVLKCTIHILPSVFPYINALKCFNRFIFSHFHTMSTGISYFHKESDLNCDTCIL